MLYIKELRTLRTQDTSDPGHFGTSLVGPNCPDRSALVPKCPKDSSDLSAELSRPKCRSVLPVFDDYGVTDPKVRLTETAHGKLRSKVEQLYYNTI